MYLLFINMSGTKHFNGMLHPFSLKREKNLMGKLMFPNIIEFDKNNSHFFFIDDCYLLCPCFVFFPWTFWAMFVIITFFTLSGAVSLMIVTYPKLGDYVLNKLESKLP